MEALIIEQSMAGIERGEMKGWPSPTRRNQLIGVIIRIVMGAQDWKPTGKKGSLVGLSTMFKRGERYARERCQPVCAVRLEHGQHVPCAHSRKAAARNLRRRKRL